VSRPFLTTGALAIALAVACGPLPTPQPGPYHPADANVSITRLVHDSVLVEIAGARFYVDPWLYSGVLFRQTEPLGLRPHALPPADAVLLTDRAGERFDRRALRQIAPRVPIAIAPTALAEELRGLGFRDVRPLEAWTDVRVGSATITAVPTGRAGANGYLLAGPDTRVLVAGPMRAFDGLGDVATAFPTVDVALLPIGGQRIFGMLREMGPEEAATAAATLQPRRIVPIGYGRTGGQPVYWYARRPLDRFRDAIGAVGLDPATIIVLTPGESWHSYRQP